VTVIFPPLDQKILAAEVLLSTKTAWKFDKGSLEADNKDPMVLKIQEINVLQLVIL
jgi:hypothetical protein